MLHLSRSNYPTSWSVLQVKGFDEFGNCQQVWMNNVTMSVSI